MKKLTVVATGRMVSVAKESILELEREGLSCGLYNARFLKPMDEAAVNTLKNCKAVVTIEDGVREGGMGEHIAAALPGVPVTLLTLPSSPLPAGTMDELLALSGLSKAGVRESIKKVAEKVR
ncbi:1-deoxy-D-xylulose-5-phosphate synthase [bioreactor metagenome]|uniref:1-deoxy-D-xylulose-5-phosphate synthase n=1 Tax=bioreactor metagenome TaxID=1076179 RepID=A0A645H553_9ZZZZ